MADPTLLKIVTDYRKAGDKDEVIKEQLVRAGWSAEDVNGALALSELDGHTSVSPAIPILPNSHQSKPEKRPGRWLSNVITLAIVIAFGIGLYYIYVHNEFSIFDFQKYLPTSPLQNINPASFTNMVATSTSSSSQ